MTPLGIPETDDVEDLWARSAGAARAWARRDRRPRGDHRGDGGQHPRLDERDQGRYRLAAFGRQDTHAVATKQTRVTPAGGDTTRTKACGSASRHGRAVARPGGCASGFRLPCSGSSPSSTGSRSRATGDAGRARTAAARGHRLRAEKKLLEQRVEQTTSLVVLAQQARRTGLVRPGEQLFIVSGIPAWRHRGRDRTVGIARSGYGGVDGRRRRRRPPARPPAADVPSRRRPLSLGAPAVTEQDPYGADGEPFPTTYYLTCPHLVAAVSRLEAAGGVERWSMAGREEELRREPERHVRAGRDPAPVGRRSHRERRRRVARNGDRRIAQPGHS